MYMYSGTPHTQVTGMLDCTQQFTMTEVQYAQFFATAEWSNCILANGRRQEARFEYAPNATSWAEAWLRVYA